MYRPRMSGGARLAATAVPVGAISSSPIVRITMLSQNPQKPPPNATLPAPIA